MLDVRKDAACTLNLNIEPEHLLINMEMEPLNLYIEPGLLTGTLGLYVEPVIKNEEYKLIQPSKGSHH